MSPDPRHPAENPLLVIGGISLVGVLIAAGFLLNQAFGPRSLLALAGSIIGLYVARGLINGAERANSVEITYVPFLGAALSRAREYTADNCAYAVVPDGIDGIVLLSGGKYLYPHVDGAQLAARASTDLGVFVWVMNALSTHPIMTKRLQALYNRGRPGRIF
ncbi:MAG: M48 family metalloprotease [Actinomycetota bacterium]|nr:M48 family metalloprotease [Actinomycetota bacterium]